MDFETFQKECKNRNIKLYTIKDREFPKAKWSMNFGHEFLWTAQISIAEDSFMFQPYG